MSFRSAYATLDKAEEIQEFAKFFRYEVNRFFRDCNFDGRQTVTRLEIRRFLSAFDFGTSHEIVWERGKTSVVLSSFNTKCWDARLFVSVLRPDWSYNA